MSFNPPPPPPPPGGGGFRPPPPRPAGGGFVPPPPPPAAAGGRPGAPPPPAGGGFAPPPPRPGGFAPPPPPGGMHNINQGMANMGFQQQPKPPGPPQGFQPPPPQPGAPRVGMFQPPPPGAAGGAPPPPPQPHHGAMPPPPGASHVGPPGQPQQQQQQQPPPPGMAPGNANGGQFFQQAPAQGQMQRAAPPAGAAPGMAPGQGAPQPFQENIDFTIKIPDRLCRFASAKIPQTAALASSAKLPLGGVLRPLAPCANSEDEDVPIVQPGSAGIIRCKRCRTYINAFVHWMEQGRRWRCNICAQMNETPAAYFCHLDEKGLRRDRLERPELSEGAVEFIAPAEYMVRPPQEPSYFFVLDVSATAVRSGMLASAANAIKQSLDDLPGGNRTKIGFITFDNSVHYYNLDPDLNQPQMMVVSDLKELFVPLPNNLLVNVRESRSVVESFLDALPEMFVKRPVVSQSCLGPALKAAFTVMKQVGGKMCVFQSIMPNLGDGALQPRENPGLMGTPNEVKILRPATSWYRDTAIEFSRQQISVDMFLFPYQYMDLAALGELPKLTDGSLFSYVTFNPQRDAKRFEQQLHKTLVQETAFEAVMRIRCTKGMRITNFYGNFNIRGTDLMALPNVNTESVFAFDLAHDEQSVTSNYVTVQAALLYTSSTGERRIRVMTQALPVTSLTTELVAGVDAMATCNLLSKQGVDIGIKTSIDNARVRMQQVCADMVRASKGGDKRTVSGYTVPQQPQQQPQGGGPGANEDTPLPPNFELLPLYTLAMMKNVGFRGGTDVHPDERVQAHHQITTMWVEQSKHFLYPRLFALHTMDQSAGTSIEDVREDDEVAGRDNILLPKVVSLTVNNLATDGIYLLDNGIDMYVWVGRGANPGLVSSLFGLHSLEGVDASQVIVQTDGDDFATRVGAIMHSLREDVNDPYTVNAKVQVVREGDGHMEARFFWFFVEDPASFQGGTFGYDDFMKFVQNPGSGPAAPPGGPRGAPAPRGMAPPGGPARGQPMPPAQQMRGGAPPAPMPPQNMGGPPGMMRGGPPQGMGGPPPPGPPRPPMGGGPPPPPGGHHMPPPAHNMPPPAMGGGPPMRAPPPAQSGAPQYPPHGAPRGMAPPPPQQQQHRGPPGRPMGAGGPPPPPPPPGGHRPPPPGPPRGGMAPPPPPPPPPAQYRR